MWSQFVQIIYIKLRSNNRNIHTDVNQTRCNNGRSLGTSSEIAWPKLACVADISILACLTLHVYAFYDYSRVSYSFGQVFFLFVAHLNIPRVGNSPFSSFPVPFLFSVVSFQFTPDYLIPLSHNWLFVVT